MTPWIIWSVVSLLALIGFFFWNFQKFLHSSSDSKWDFPGDDYDYVIRNLSLVILPLVIALPFTVGLCIYFMILVNTFKTEVYGTLDLLERTLSFHRPCLHDIFELCGL